MLSPLNVITPSEFLFRKVKKMGLWDDIKAGAKNVDSKIGQKYDEEKIESEIRKIEKDIVELKRILGEDVYESYSEGKAYDPAADCKIIKSKYDDIDGLKAEKERIIAEAKAEREANRQAKN